MSPLNEMLHDHENRVAVKEHELADVFPLFHQPVEAEVTEETKVRGGKILSWPMVAALALLPIVVFLADQMFPFNKISNIGADQVSVAPINLDVATQVISPVIGTRSQPVSSRKPIAPLTSSQVVAEPTPGLRLARWTAEAETKYLSIPGRATREEGLSIDAVSQHLSGRDNPTDRQILSDLPGGILAVSEQGTQAEASVERAGSESIVAKRGSVVKSQSGVMKENAALRKAKNLIFDGRRQQAISHLTALLKVTPNADNARLVLAGWLAQDGEWEKVNPLLSGVDERSDQRFRRLKARMYIQQGDVRQAMALLESNMPDLGLVPEYYTLLGVIYQRVGKFSESVAVYERLIRTDQARGDWWGGLAIGLDQSGDKMAALDAYREALRSFDIQPHIKQYASQRIALLSRSAG